MSLVVHDQARALGERLAARSAILGVDKRALEMRLVLSLIGGVDLEFLVGARRQNLEAGVRLAALQRLLHPFGRLLGWMLGFFVA